MSQACSTFYDIFKKARSAARTFEAIQCLRSQMLREGFRAGLGFFCSTICVFRTIFSILFTCCSVFCITSMRSGKCFVMLMPETHQNRQGRRMKKNKKIRDYALAFLVVWGSSLFSNDASENPQILEKHVQLLANIDCSKTHRMNFAGIHFNNQMLMHCLKEIEKQQSFAPLLQTWQTLQAEPQLDAMALGQFSVILLLCYHSSFACYSSRYRLAWISLITLYTQLNMIPLKKLFDALDECYQQYKIIFETLPQDENVSFSEWLESYWWAPALVIVFTVYSYLRWQQSRPVAP